VRNSLDAQQIGELSISLPIGDMKVRKVLFFSSLTKSFTTKNWSPTAVLENSSGSGAMLLPLLGAI
jgi:hypothetical protein